MLGEWIDRADWFSFVPGKARFAYAARRRCPFSLCSLPASLPLSTFECLVMSCSRLGVPLTHLLRLWLLQRQGAAPFSRLPAAQGRLRCAALPGRLGRPRLDQRARHAVQVLPGPGSGCADRCLHVPRIEHCLSTCAPPPTEHAACSRRTMGCRFILQVPGGVCALSKGAAPAGEAGPKGGHHREG